MPLVTRTPGPVFCSGGQCQCQHMCYVTQPDISLMLSWPATTKTPDPHSLPRKKRKYTQGVPEKYPSNWSFFVTCQKDHQWIIYQNKLHDMTLCHKEGWEKIHFQWLPVSIMFVLSFNIHKKIIVSFNQLLFHIFIFLFVFISFFKISCAYCVQWPGQRITFNTPTRFIYPKSALFLWNGNEI